MIIVVDASVAVKWFLPEPHSDQTALLLASEHDLIAPDLIRLEIGSVLLRALRSREISDSDAEEALETLPNAVRLLASAEHAGFAFGIARRFGGSVYDAVYIALAQAIDAPVITNDASMATLARAAGVEARMIMDGLSRLRDE